MASPYDDISKKKASAIAALKPNPNPDLSFGKVMGRIFGADKVQAAKELVAGKPDSPMAVGGVLERISGTREARERAGEAIPTQDDPRFPAPVGPNVPSPASSPASPRVAGEFGTQPVASQSGTPSEFQTTSTGKRGFVPGRTVLPAETLSQVADYRKSRGPGAQTEFGPTDMDAFQAPEGSYAMQMPGGGIVSSAPGWSEADQARLDQLRAEGYGSGAGRDTGAPSVASPKTSPWQRRTDLRNAAVGAPSDWDRRHMTDSQYKTAMGAHQAGIDRVADRFAAEDKQQTLRDVAQTRAGAQGGSGFAEQLGLARLGLDTAKARETQQQNIFERGQAKAKAGREQTDAFNEQLGQAVDRYGLPSWGEDLLRELGGAPMEMGARIQRILEEDPNLKAAIEARGSWLASDETDAETRESAMATLRQRLTGEA